jgi:hypothetical protein
MLEIVPQAAVSYSLHQVIMGISALHPPVTATIHVAAFITAMIKE